MSNPNDKSSAQRGAGSVRLPEVVAVEFVRRMLGGSQPSMIRCNDGNYYVVKMMENPQGSSVLGNECLGNCLLGRLGLPIPSFSAVRLSQDFIDDNPGCWFTSCAGFPVRPPSGWHFGSQLVGDTLGLEWPTQWLSQSQYALIANTADFMPMFMLDVWANNYDSRQVVYTAGAPQAHSKSIRAVFIDNGYMFGGADGVFDKESPARRYRERGIYKALCNAQDKRSLLTYFRKRIPRILPLCLQQIPYEWYAFQQNVLQDVLLDRLARLDVLLKPYEELPSE